ncbi:hypothetical protein HZS_43 [Henneguya salminicola]|nr:hypothetical protein HZS_43 [Henneguya salminicola]
MHILVDYIRPMSSIDFTVDPLVMNFDETIFTEINIALLFKAQTKLSSCLPHPYNEKEYPSLVLPDCSVALKNQNMYLNDRFEEINEKYLKLKSEFEINAHQLKIQDFMVDDYKGKYNELLNENGRIKIELEEKEDKLSHYKIKSKQLKLLIIQKDEEIKVLGLE